MFELFMAELRRSWLQLIRYPGDAVGLIVITTSVFYGLFLGTQYMAGPSIQFGERLEEVIVGYVLWSLVGFIIVDLVGQLQYEAQTGTLEQLFLSQFGFKQVLLLRALANLTLRLIITLVIFLCILLITGASLTISAAILLPLTSVLMGAYGLAFAIGSLVLLIKRADQVVSIFLFAVLFLMTATTETWLGWLQLIRWLLPMTGGAGLMRDLMSRELTIGVGQFCLSALNGFAYLMIGLLIFDLAEQIAKKSGRLGEY
ncbi:ABC-2 type transporter superfamily [Synechococcus sp. PCC 7335]|nr:ABC-2 type transporter superfamily [Synechococcus sp. PCC 7335]